MDISQIQHMLLGNLEQRQKQEEQWERAVAKHRPENWEQECDEMLATHGFVCLVAKEVTERIEKEIRAAMQDGLPMLSPMPASLQEHCLVRLQVSFALMLEAARDAWSDLREEEEAKEESIRTEESK